MEAAGGGMTVVAQLLLDHQADIDIRYPAHGGTAFHCACLEGHIECAEALVRAGCDTRLRDNLGRNGQQIAAVNGHAELVKRLRSPELKSVPRRQTLDREMKQFCTSVKRAGKDQDAAAKALLQLLDAGHEINALLSTGHPHPGAEQAREKMGPERFAGGRPFRATALHVLTAHQQEAVK